MHHNAKIKFYFNGDTSTVIASKPIFQDVSFELVTPRKKSVVPNWGNESRYDNLLRAKKKVFDIAMMNDFDYFITLTIDSRKLDRYDPVAFKKKVQSFLKNLVSRSDGVYLLIPEHHKDGAVHAHMLYSGKLQLVDSGKKDKSGRTIYNLPQWKIGFSTAIELDKNKGLVARYITKYITKESKKIFGNFYLAGGKTLVRDVPYQLFDVDFDAVEATAYFPPDFEVAFKYLNSYEVKKDE